MSAVSFHPLIETYNRRCFFFPAKKNSIWILTSKTKSTCSQKKHCIASPWTYTYTCIRIIYLYSTSVSKALPCLSGCCLSLLGGLCRLLGDTSTLVGHLHRTWLTAKVGWMFHVQPDGEMYNASIIIDLPHQKNSQLPIINDFVSFNEKKKSTCLILLPRPKCSAFSWTNGCSQSF